MEIFKKASKVGLRVQTTKGLLSVEQLWTLSLIDISNAIKTLKKQMNTSIDSELDFLSETSTKVDETTQLSFDILKDIYLTKKEENKLALEVKEKKALKQRIIEELAKRKDESYGKMTDSELEALLKGLDD